MTYALRKRAKSNDYDLVDADGVAIGQIVSSANGFTIYLIGDYEQLLPPAETADEALEAFEDWAASNTLSDLLVVKPDSSEAEVEPDPGP